MVVGQVAESVTGWVVPETRPTLTVTLAVLPRVRLGVEGSVERRSRSPGFAGLRLC